MCPAWFISAGCVAGGDEALAARLANNNLGHYQLIRNRWIGYLGVLDSPHGWNVQVGWRYYGEPPHVLCCFWYGYLETREEKSSSIFYILLIRYYSRSLCLCSALNVNPVVLSEPVSCPPE